MRQLAGPGHLAGPQLVEDLAGLRVAAVVDRGGLVGGQHGQRLHRDLRPERERLERGDDRVAAEQRREPRHAGRDVALVRARAVVDEQPQVVDGALHDAVEDLVVAVDRRGAVVPGPVRRGAFIARDEGRLREERRRGGFGGGIRGHGARVGPHGPAQLAGGARLEGQAPAQPDRGPGVERVGRHRGHLADLGRGLRERQVGAAPDPVEPVVAEGDPLRRDRHRQERPAGRSRIAADLEDVRVVGAHVELDRDRDRTIRVVHDADQLLEGAAPDQPVAGDPDRPPDEVVERVDLHVRVPVGGRVGQLDRAAVVAAHRPLEEDRPLAADVQHRARQQPRVGPVQAQAARIRMDVAELVGQQVDVAVLEDLDRPEVGRPRDRPDARLHEPHGGGLRRRHRPRSRH